MTPTTVDALIAARPGFDQMRAASQTEASPIRDFIFMSQGTSNAYAVRTSDSRVVINTGMGFEARIHKPLFDRACPLPTRYIFLTQGHVDHLGGVSHFREQQTELVAQASNASCQADDARIAAIRRRQAYIWFQHVTDQAIAAAAEHPEAFVQDTPQPDVTFDDTLALETGGTRFEMYATPGGETVDSCVVWLPQHGILFSGNLFGPLFPHFPNFNTIRGDKYRFAEPYLASLDRVRRLEPELLVTGHFDPIEGRTLIRESLDRLEGAVRHVHDETLRGMNAGKDVFTLMREIALPKSLTVGEGYGKVSWAVRTFWESYMGWFRAQSTSELYATPVASVYAEVCALAGCDQLVARGREHLANGDPELALHFAEIALAGGDGVAAKDLARDVHAALLERKSGPNFWEDGWLRHRIAQLGESN